MLLSKQGNKVYSWGSSQDFGSRKFSAYQISLHDCEYCALPITVDTAVL